MDLIILDTELNIIDIIDTFESSIWTERYIGYGDFEIYAKVSDQLISIATQECYVKISESDRIMIVEEANIKSDPDNGSTILIKGRSYESIIARRIIWKQTILTGNLQNGIKKLMDENAITPSDTDREIPNLTFLSSTDPEITSLTVDMQFTYDDLYESIVKLCSAHNIGFKITLSDDLSGFVFELYNGVNRSYDQLTNPFVVFSKEYDNLLNSDYSKSTTNKKTLTLVAGEGEGESRKTEIVGNGIGLERREMYTDARDISQTVDSVLISDVTYYAQLNQRGLQDLSENAGESSFDSQVDTLSNFKYGVDFFLGDIVQVVSEYGISIKARVTELIRSQSASGIETYPKFTIIE